jgi:hypothetical protein
MNAVTWPNGITLYKIEDPRLVETLAKYTGIQKQRQKKGSAYTFPGPNPVSIERADYPKLRAQPYHITEKTDGVRALMMIIDVDTRHLVIVFDRTLTPYLFPIHYMPRALYQGTVFDGEIVYDKADARWVFLCFDAINIAGVPIFHLPFSERLRHIATSLQFYKESASDPGIIRPKMFLPFVAEIAPAFAAHVETMKTRYDVDGVIFQPELDRVIYGRHDNLMKLKTTHSVDFIVKKGKLNIFDETTRRNKIIGLPAGPLKHLATEDAIVECVQENGEWHVLQVRTDKHTSNNKFTLEKTLLNAKEALTLHDVLQGTFAIPAHGNQV